MFAKIDKLKLLRKLSGENLLSAEEVKEELLVSKKYGYDFVDKILREIKFLDLNKKERNEYENILEINNKLGFGEIQAIVLAKNRNYTVLTNDKVACGYCKKNNIDYLNIQRILRFMIIESLISTEKAMKVVEEIEGKDNTIIRNKEGIWKGLE